MSPVSLAPESGLRSGFKLRTLIQTHNPVTHICLPLPPTYIYNKIIFIQWKLRHPTRFHKINYHIIIIHAPIDHKISAASQYFLLKTFPLQKEFSFVMLTITLPLKHPARPLRSARSLLIPLEKNLTPTGTPVGNI